jgi:hypothetical protein
MGLLVLWLLLALATMADALWLLRRRLKWGA